MNNLKKILLIAVAVLSFAACGNDNEENKKNKDTVNSSLWVGNLTVTPENFQLDSLVVKTTCTSKTNTCKIEMNKVKFASAMPHQLDIIIDGVSFSVSNGDTILSGANIASQYDKEGELADAGYLISSINGKISNGKLTATVEGTYKNTRQINFLYEGTRK
ncbi:MAG: hypothetical protein IJ681_08690 [Bacteroidales bacterium]|nr:hypothetical protein [Bacteroidales bacterium]